MKRSIIQSLNRGLAMQRRPTTLIVRQRPRTLHSSMMLCGFLKWTIAPNGGPEKSHMAGQTAVQHAEGSLSLLSPGTLGLSEAGAALSYALDITEGQPEGHAVRTCMIGMRLSREIYLSAKQRTALFYALLLKDLGCSSNASKLSHLF